VEEPAKTNDSSGQPASLDPLVRGQLPNKVREEDLEVIGANEQPNNRMPHAGSEDKTVDAEVAVERTGANAAKRVVPWWLTPGIILFVLAFFVYPWASQIKSSAIVNIQAGASTQPGNGISGLRLGLYDWPSTVAHYSVALDPALRIQVQMTTVHELDRLIPIPGPLDIPFDMTVVPFSAVVESSESIKSAGWSLIWVCDESNEMDRVLVRKYIKRNHRRVIDGNWLTLKNTRAAHELDVYLDSAITPGGKLDYRYERLHEYRSAEELLQSIDEMTVAIAVHEPWDHWPESLNGFEDDTDFANAHHREHEVNVVLARNKVLEDVESRKTIVHFLKNLLDFPRSQEPPNVDARQIFAHDLKLRDDLLPSKFNLGSKDEEEILAQDLPVELKNNLEFLYGFGAFRCEAIAEDQIQHISWEKKKHPSPCTDLIHPQERNRLIGELQNAIQDAPTFTAQEFDELCISDRATEHLVTLWPFVRKSFDPTQRTRERDTPAEQLNGFIRAHTQDAGHSYCVVGHGDIVGSLDFNKGLGLTRANQIKDRMKKRNFLPERLIAISQGKEAPLTQGVEDQDQNRRVEIRRIYFDVRQ
jgi:hypothetical protein